MMVTVQQNERIYAKRPGVPIEGESWPIPALPAPPRVWGAHRRRRRSRVPPPSWTPCQPLRLGRKLVELGAAYLSRLDEVQEFYRFCEQAPTLSGETVRIAMLDGTNVIYLARYEGHPAVRLTSNIGDKMPVSLCAVGKALIARLHDHDVDVMFSDDAQLPVLTPKSLRTGAELKAQLTTIREQGYAFEDEESTTGVVCLAVAVPTRGAHGPSLGLSVTALKATYSAEQGSQMVKELNELARSLGNPMG